MSNQFYANATISLDKRIDGALKLVATKLEDLNYVYEISKCVEWIKAHNFQKVCLQFPDFLLIDSTEIAMRLESILGQSIYIMADTAYESCCIDYITAAHVDADAIIHFGPVCFSKASDNIPCLKIYEKGKLDVGLFVEIFHGKVKQSENVAILLDTPYLIYIDLIREIFGNIRIYSISAENLELNEFTVVFIGHNSRKALNLNLSYRPRKLYYYNPMDDCRKLVNYEEDPKILKRRYYLMEKIKDSSTIGIVIGTVAVRNYLKVIDRVKKLISCSGKKYYTISVGKPTVTKLANFPEIDVYVIITCAMNEIYESREFYKPLVTPYDVELALNPKANSSKFSYDFNKYLPKEDLTEIDLERMRKNNNLSDVSLLTGKIRLNHVEEKKDKVLVEEVQVALKDEGTVALNASYGAGFLLGKSWKGLEQNLGHDKAAIVVEGHKGVAQEYENEQRL